jgi:hypothetical protein
LDQQAIFSYTWCEPHSVNRLFHKLYTGLTSILFNYFIFSKDSELSL